MDEQAVPQSQQFQNIADFIKRLALAIVIQYHFAHSVQTGTKVRNDCENCAKVLEKYIISREVCIVVNDRYAYSCQHEIERIVEDGAKVWFM